METTARVASALERMAKTMAQTAGGETYQTVEKNEDYRLGLIAASADGVTQYSVELVLRVFKPSSTIDLISLESAVAVVRELADQGYFISHEDDGWLHCEKALEADAVSRECEDLLAILEDHYATRED